MLSLCCDEVLALVTLLLVYKAADWLVRRFYLPHPELRYIFITGCDTGFGSLAARRLDTLGCHVIAGCLTEGGETALRKAGCSARLHTVVLDVARPDSVRSALQAVRALLPPGVGLWGLVNNAGIVSLFGPPECLTLADYKSVADVNLYGLIDVTMTFLPLVKAARGRVVNMSSMSGRTSLPYITPYSVSKYGVEAFTDGLRRALYPYGVKALLVEPGGHRTPFTARGSVGRSVRGAWAQAPGAVRAEYGQQYIDFCLTTAVDTNAKLPYGSPDAVVDAYVHALLGRFPRARYVVGTDVKFIYLPLQWLPEWAGDWAWGALLRLSGMPLPAAVLAGGRGTGERCGGRGENGDWQRQ